MICHIVLIRLKPQVTELQAGEFLDRAKEVLGPIPGVTNLRVGEGLGVKSEVDYPYCLVMDFADDDALEGYQVHSEHQRFVKEILGHIGEDKKVFDYRY